MDIVDGIKEIERLRAENERLDAENQRLSEHNYRLYTAIRQNREDVMDAQEPARAYEACERLWAVLMDA